ncbi:MAG TPA: sulfite exporter TauE/SafE family protein [Actinomycetota bacterium]|nr:sulfite exporter TauE/SafE family protein [Actinomycetota bacterium]
MPLIIVFALVGGIAQFVDGTLGMGFGITSATLLTLLGYSAVAASAGTHAAKIGTNLVSGLAHWREGNLDWRVMLALAVPGSIGAFLGAVVLTNVSLSGARIWMALILLVLGVSIVMRFAFGKSLIPQVKVRTRHLWPVGLFGGFVDATGGGGWGPVATPSLLTLTKHEPRKVVGTVNAAEFAVAIFASMGFLVGAKESQIPWGAVAGLIIGGLLVAPFAARFASRAPVHSLGTLVGGMVIISNLAVIFKLFGMPGAIGGAVCALVAVVVISLAWRVHRADVKPGEQVKEPVLV